MIIREFACSFARATGTQPTQEQIKAVEVDLCAQFGGERFYVPSHPKAKHQAMAAHLMKQAKKSKRQVAVELGLSVSGLRKALNGNR
jgi:hypothetical protein